MQRRFVPLVVVLSLPAASLHAQRPDAAGVQDSLAAVSDVAMLRQLAQTEPADNARALVAHGLTALRLFSETGAEDDAELAERSFERAVELEPRNAWAHFGYGAAMARIGRPQIPPPPLRAPTGFLADDVLLGALGIDNRSRGQDALMRALRLDPTHTDAALTLLHMGLERRDDEAIRAAATALSMALQRGDADEQELLALSYAASAVGDAATALDAAERAMNRSPRPDAAARRAHALALLRSPERRDEGAAAYFAAIAAADSTSLALFFEDVRHIRDERDAAVFNMLTTAERRAWLRDFWTLRAAMSGIEPESRIAEHYQRLSFVEQHFPRRRWAGPPPKAALIWERDPTMPYDDRGAVYLRHGEPEEAVRSRRGRGVTWIYRGPDGNPQLFNFSGDEEYADYVLLYEVPCDYDWLERRIEYSEKLRDLLARCSGPRRRWTSLEIRRYVRSALTTDSDYPDFARSLDFSHRLYNFRAPNGATELLAAIGVADPAVQRVRASFVAADTILDHYGTADTVLALAAGSNGDDGRREAALSLETRAVPHGMYRLFIRNAADSTHGEWYGGEVRVRDFTGPRLQLSDLVLGPADGVPTLQRGSARVVIATNSEFPGGRMRVFYELYNLAPDARHVTEITIREPGGAIGRAVGRLFGADDPVRLRFEEQAAPDSDGVVRVTREVGASLPPGDYELRVKVRVGRREVEQAATFTVPSA